MNIFNCFKRHKASSKFNLLPDGIFTLAQDGKIIDVNDKILKIYSTTRFNILGHYFSDFVKNGTAILNEIIATDSKAQALSIPKEKGQMPVLLELSASRTAEGSRVYVCIRTVDIEQQEKMALLETTKEKYSVAKKIVDEKNDFLTSSSGTILSSLVSIGGFSRALLDGFAGQLNEKQKKYLNIINYTSKDLNYDLEHLFKLFELESQPIDCSYKVFDIISLIKSIERVYDKDLRDKKVIFNLNYSQITNRDCFLDSQIVEYILRCIMDIFLRFSNLGKCFLNIGHPPMDFLQTRDFSAKTTLECDKYILFEAKITDLTFLPEELENIFDAYYKSPIKRPIGLRATLNLLKIYIKNFGGDIWVYSKQNFGTMFTFVLPLKQA